MIGSAHFQRPRLFVSMLLLATALLASPIHAQTTSIWTGTTGDWSNSGNWSNGVPNGNYNALINNGSPVPATANLDINATVANLTLDPGNALNILAGNALTFQSPSGSTLDNSGTVSIASSASIVIGAGNSLSLGSGTIQLNGGSIVGATGLETLNNLNGGTIVGNGTISGVGFNTQGGITATGGTLTINTNSQGFEAGANVITIDAGSTLNITGGPFKNYDSTTGQLSETQFDVKGTLQFDNADIRNLNILTGTFTLDGPDARIVNQFNQNALSNLGGVTGNGTFSLTNGASLTTSGSFGNDFRSTVSISNGSSMTINGGLSSEHAFDVSGSTLTVNGNVGITNGDAGSLLAVSNGSTVNVHGDFDFGLTIVNSLTVDASSVTVSGNLNSSSDNNGFFGGHVTVSDGGILNIQGTVNNSGGAPITIETGSVLSIGKDLNNSGVLTLASGSAGLVSGTVTNSGTIQVDNTSVLTVKSGFNQSAGSTVVNGVLNAPAAGVNIQGGTLSGTGFVNGNVVMAGTMMPGASTGILTINGNYTQTATGLLVEQIGWIDGQNADLLRVNGAVNLDGTLDLSLLPGYGPTAGDSFTLMTFLSDSGTFDTVTGLNLGNNLFLDLIYDAHDIRVEVESLPVGTPEPGSFLLLLVGGGVVLAVARKRLTISAALVTTNGLAN
jgi:fibronectin-binding autotransporter adhesin